MARELPKVYEPQQVENEIYKMWEDGGYFRPQGKEGAKPFTIVMPPPNVTGQLHMGHAMDATLQDTLIRFKRMQGYDALWIPGVDHAGIATQIKVEEELRKNEGLSRYDLGREKFRSVCGIGNTSMATASWSSRKSWVPPAIGSELGLPWMKVAPRPYVRSSFPCTKRA